MNRFSRPIRLAFASAAAALTVGCATVKPSAPFVPQMISIAEGCATVTTQEKARPIIAVDQICMVVKIDDARQKYAAEERAAEASAREDVVKALAEKGGVPGAMTAIGYYTNEGRLADMPPTLVQTITKLQEAAAQARTAAASAPLPAASGATVAIENKKHVVADKKIVHVVANDNPPQKKPTATNVVNNILAKAKDAAPNVAVAAVAAGTNMAIKKGIISILGAKFGLAAAAATLPGAIGAVAAAVAIGVVVGGVIGGLAEMAKEAIDRDRNSINYKDSLGFSKNNGWKGKAFMRGAKRGALWGAIGGGVAEIATNALSSGGYLHNLFSHNASPANVAAPVHASTASAPAPQVVAPPVEVAAPTLSQSVQSLLSDEQMKSLPKAVQKLAESQKPEDLLRFCKEASYNLINNSHNNPDSLKAGANLIKRGLDVAKESGLHTKAVRMLNTDWNFVTKSHLFRGMVSAMKPA